MADLSGYTSEGNAKALKPLDLSMFFTPNRIYFSETRSI